MPQASLDSDILEYIVTRQMRPGERLPTITELSRELGVSVSKIREELEVVRTLGLVQIKPRTGTLVQEFDFGPAATLSVLYALGLNRSHFYDFAQVRKHIELSFWQDAVTQLTPDDISMLRQLVARAQEKLSCTPIEVPFEEHRALHLLFFKHLANPFVQGLLEAYWTAYEVVGVGFYAELSYLREVWTYHERVVECVARGEFEAGRLALQEHMALLKHVPEPESAERVGSKSTEPVYHFFE
jgi:DNA-binding FadR family transcriptional regulator